MLFRSEEAGAKAAPQKKKPKSKSTPQKSNKKKADVEQEEEEADQQADEVSPPAASSASLTLIAGTVWRRVRRAPTPEPASAPLPDRRDVTTSPSRLRLQRCPCNLRSSGPSPFPSSSVQSAGSCLLRW